MTTVGKIILTVLVVVAWLSILGPLTLFGVLSRPAFIVAVVLSVVALGAIWSRWRWRGRSRA